MSAIKQVLIFTVILFIIGASLFFSVPLMRDEATEAQNKQKLAGGILMALAGIMVLFLFLAVTLG